MVSDNASTKINFDTVEYDTVGLWDAGSPSRIVVQDGVAFIRFSFNVLFPALAPAAGSSGRVGIWKNGASFSLSSTVHVGLNNSAADNTSAIQGVSPFLQVNKGDYFELVVKQVTGGNLTFGNGTVCWLAVETRA